jgi:Dockerin type I domain
MMKNDKQPDDLSQTKMPQEFTDDLKATFGGRVFVPSEVDNRVLAEGRQHLTHRRSAWRTGWAASVAAVLVAAIGLAILIPTLRHARGPIADSAPHMASKIKTAPSLREDIDRSGTVDILDAFALARHLETPANVTLQWDMDGDGIVDQTDIDHIASMAVQLDKETL